jgi:4-amino-4-deoxy-L-arabinose transferase-like glycosyltransferase
MGIIIDIITLVAPVIIISSFIAISIAILYIARWSLKNSHQYKNVVYTGCAIALTILLYLYFYYAYSNDALTYLIKALISIPLILFLPGYLLYQVFIAEKIELRFIEKIYLQMSGSILVSGLIGLLLADAGLFSLIHLLISILVVCCIIWWKLNFKVSVKFNTKININVYEIGLILILILAVSLFFHPNPWILGGRDQGVYINTGVNIANTGSILIHDNLLKSLNVSEYGNFFSIGDNHSNNPAIYEGSQYPGFYITDSQTGAVTPQFFYLWPSWIAIFYSIFGLSIGLFVTPFFAVLSIISIYLVGKTLFNSRVGLLAAFFSTLNFAFIWYSREPTTEIFTMFLIFLGIFAFVHLSRQSSFSKYYYAIIASLCLGEIFLTRIDTVLLLIPFILFLVYLWVEHQFKAEHMVFVIISVTMGIYALLSAIFISTPYTFDIIGLTLSDRLISLFNHLSIFSSGMAVLFLASIISFDYRGFVSHKIKNIVKFLPYIRAFIVILILLGMIYLLFIRPQGEITSDSYNLVKVSWYMGGFFGVVLASLGCIMILYKKPYRESYFFLSIFLMYSIFYILSAKISPDQPWWIRRYLPIVIPMAIICIAYFIDQLYMVSKSSKIIKVISMILIILLIIPSIASDLKIVSFQEYGHALEDVDNMSKMFSDNSIILYTSNYYTERIATPLHYIYGKNVTSVNSYNQSLDMIDKWIASNKTVYLIDTIGNNDISQNNGNFSSYSVAWTVIEDLSWQNYYYFYLPYDPQVQRHTYYITNLSNLDSLNYLIIFNTSNFYDVEYWNATPTRWESNNASIYVYSPNDTDVVLSFNITSFYQPRTLRIYLNGGIVDDHQISTEFNQIAVPLHLKKGNNDIMFSSLEGSESPSNIKELNNIDPRNFSFAFQNMSIQV